MKEADVWRTIAEKLMAGTEDSTFLCYAAVDLAGIKSKVNREVFKPRVQQVLEAAPESLVGGDGGNRDRYLFLPEGREGAIFRAGIATALAAWAEVDARAQNR